jgi:small subunit ribosomal protein S20
LANHKSAKKRARQTIKRTLNNKVKNSRTKSALKAIRTAISGKDKAKALELLPGVQGVLDKLSKTGFIKPNKAARTTSRLSSQISSL